MLIFLFSLIASVLDDMWREIRSKYCITSVGILPLQMDEDEVYGLVWNHSSSRYFLVWKPNKYFCIQDRKLDAALFYSVADWPIELKPRLITWPEYKFVSVRSTSLY